LIITGIDHKLTIIAIFRRVFNRIEQKDFASLVTLNGNTIPTIWNRSLADFNQFAFFGGAMVLLPIEGRRTENRDSFQTSLRRSQM